MVSAVGPVEWTSSVMVFALHVVGHVCTSNSKFSCMCQGFVHGCWYIQQFHGIVECTRGKNAHKVSTRSDLVNEQGRNLFLAICVVGLVHNKIYHHPMGKWGGALWCRLKLIFYMCLLLQCMRMVWAVHVEYRDTRRPTQTCLRRLPALRTQAGKRGRQASRRSSQKSTGLI